MLWHVQYPGFNCSFALFREHLYYAAIGTIGKIDTKTGMGIWRNSDLYQKIRFNSATAFYHNGNELTVEGQDDRGREGIVLVFDDKSGALKTAINKSTQQNPK